MSAPYHSRPTAPQSTNYRFVIIIAMMLPHVFGFIILESLGLMLPSINREFHLSPTEEGILGSAPRIGMMILALPAGLWFSKLNAKHVTTITFILGALLVLVQGWSPIFAVLLLARALYGISMVVREPVRAMLVRQWALPREVVTINALSNMLWGVTAVGFLLVPLLLRVLDDDWRTTFYIFAAGILGLTVIWHILGKERISPQYQADMLAQTRSPISSIFRYRELWFLAFGVLGNAAAWSAFAVFWPSLMLEKFGLSELTSGSIIAIGGGVSAFAGIGVGLLTNKIGKKRVILWWCGVGMAATQVGFLWTGSFGWLVLITAVNGVAWAHFPIVLTIPFQLPNIKPREIATAIGFLETAVWAGALVGPILTGALEDFALDPRLALMVTAAMPISLSIAAMLLPRKWDELTV